MRTNRGLYYLLRWAGVALIFIGAMVAVFQLVRYSRVRTIFPAGMMVGEVPVGGLEQKDAADRILQAYSVPVEIRYREAVIQIKPAVVGFEVSVEAMMAAADLERVRMPFWQGFWNYLWGRLPEPSRIPLASTLSTERLRAFLKDEVAPRYDQAPVAALPVPGTVDYQTGQAGTTLDVERAVVLISDALRSPSSRVVNLTYSKVAAPRPSFQNLQVALSAMVDQSGFDGLFELFLLDLQTGQEIHFAQNNGQVLPPDVGFTAASTIKIPIMVSVFRRVGDPAPKEVKDQLALMIDRSENDPADQLMKSTMDRDQGPLEVTKDMQALGLNNTFLAGYFAPGSPLLKKIETTANKRKDASTDPDTYNQTVPSEMAMLLEDIYQCSETGGGTFAAVFPGQITQAECREMVKLLANNKIAVLVQAGLPEGTQIAHKHGWVIALDGLMHTISDAGIVYTPGGNYVLTIYMYHPAQLLWDPANQLVGQMSRSIYNYFNLGVESD